MFRLLVLSTAAVALGLLATNRASAYEHEKIHAAIHELKEAHTELKESPDKFGGHKERALEDIDAAYRQLEKCLEAVGAPYKSYSVPPKAYDGYNNHKHLRHALHELKEAKVYLEKTAIDFKGHKKKAIEDMNAAIKQIEICIEYIK